MIGYEEKRRCSRVPVPMHVEVRLDSGVLIDGRVVNLSLNGLLFETERSLPVGHCVRVYLTHESTPHEHCICCGEVSRLDDWGVAIAFGPMSREEQAFLSHCLEDTVECASLVKV